MRGLIAGAVGAADRFEPRGLPLAVTRSTLAFVELVGIGLTPDRALFADDPGLSSGVQCGGVHGLSLWCVAGSGAHGLAAGRIVAILVLAVAMSGYRPRWTCLPQWYVTFSLTAAVPAPYGADNVAVVATMLLVPMLLGDERTWHWTAPRRPQAPVWRGSSYAAWWALRCQIALIYLDAAVSKLWVAQWRDGTAMYTVFVDPDFGLAPAVRHTAGGLLASAGVAALTTWSVIGVELGIAGCALAVRSWRRAGIVLAILLHGAIILLMGLVGFGLTMIAVVLTLLPSGRGASAAQDRAPRRGSGGAGPDGVRGQRAADYPEVVAMR
jgi:antimicrobial peptide system SdpB family protein